MTASREATPDVREAAQADLLEVVRIERASFPQPWPLAAFERFVGDRSFLVAEADGSIVGYVVADVVPSQGRPMGHIKDIAVRPDRRNQGIGTILLERALGVLEAAGAREVRLEVRESNGSAAGLYRSFGFDHHDTVPGYYDNGEDALVMVRDIQCERTLNTGKSR